MCYLARSLSILLLLHILCLATSQGIGACNHNAYMQWNLGGRWTCHLWPSFVQHQLLYGTYRCLEVARVLLFFSSPIKGPNIPVLLWIGFSCMGNSPNNHTECGLSARWGETPISSSHLELLFKHHISSPSLANESVSRTLAFPRATHTFTRCWTSKGVMHIASTPKQRKSQVPTTLVLTRVIVWLILSYMEVGTGGGILS